MSAASKTKTQKKNAKTQTNPTDTMLEIAHLQEQVKLLTIENDHLRKYTMEELSSRLNPVTPVRRQIDINNTPRYTRSAQKNLQTPSTQEKGNKLSTRCACKGKCSTKVCGCVKKNVPCGPLCKCNIAVCKNQENKDTDQNKENLENIELTPKYKKNKETKNKHLVNVAESESMFSPDVRINDSDFNIEELRESLYFGSPKQLIFDTNKEEEEEKENEKQNKKRKDTMKSIKVDKNNQKSATKKKGEPRKLISEVDVTKHMQENKDIVNEEEQDQDNKELTKYVRICIPDLEEPQINEKTKEIEKRTNNYVQNIANASHDEVNNNSKLFQQKEKNSQNIKTSSKNEPYSINEGDKNVFNPKHQLPRTPIRGLSTSRDENSDISLATSVTLDEGRQIPEVFSEPEVNWEEYKSQLVACGKCKRKFHLLRIKKHESCCKKV